MEQQEGLKKSAVYYKTRRAILDTDGFVSSCGGARSGKTISILQNLFELAALDYTPTITSVVSETFPHLKRGAIRDLPVALGDFWDETAWSKGESILRVPNRGGTESILEFFSADAPAKVHGPARDRIFINEAQNIPYDTARHLFIRTRGLKILDYNPTHDGWMQQRIETRPECVTIHSTYLDNEFLPPEQVREIEANKADANWWRVYGEGLVGTLDGLIYPDFDLIDAMPPRGGLREIYGLDFGFTHDPTAIVRVLADTGRKTAYVEQICYRTGMLNSDIAATLNGQGIARQTAIWADAAEPKSIAEIGGGTGLNVRACDKSAPVRSDRLKWQLQWMQGWRLKVTKSSLDLIHELRNYTWAKDRDGNVTGSPIDAFNHCFVGGTRITTIKGDKPIRRIKPGDIVLTSEGYRRVINKWDNGRKKILLLSIKFANFEIVMRATPDHKIKTTQGWKQLKDLQAGDEIYLLKSLTGKCTASTQGSGIFQEGANACTASCGNITTGQSRRIATFITKTATRITTIFQTLFASRANSTKTNTGKKAAHAGSPKEGLRISAQPENLQRFGTEATRATNGTPSTPANNGRTWKSGKRSASAAERCSNIVPSISPDSAPTPASQNGGGMHVLTMKPGFAPSVERSSEQITIQTPAPARALVVRSIAGRYAARKRRVFDLTIEDCHEYFANGVLVHNCMDAMRYALFSELAGKETAGNYTIGFNRYPKQNANIHH